MIGLEEDGYSEIHNAEKRSYNQSIHARFLKRWRDTGFADHLPRTARPRMASHPEDSVLRCISQANRNLTFPELLFDRFKYANLDGSNVSTEIVCRRHENIRIKWQRPRDLPLLKKSIIGKADWPGRAGTNPELLNNGGQSFLVTKVTFSFTGIRQANMRDSFQVKHFVPSV